MTSSADAGSTPTVATAASSNGKTLPYTGLDLWTVVGVGLTLMASGLLIQSQIQACVVVTQGRDSIAGAVALALTVIRGRGLGVRVCPRDSAAPTQRGLPVPSTFVGVDADGPMFDPATSGLNLAHQFDTMVAAGVESVRVAFNWAAAQPYQSWRTSPPASRPVHRRRRRADRLHARPTSSSAGRPARSDACCRRSCTRPSWDAVDNASGVDTRPARGPFAAYLTALIDRYGPHGSFWSSHPRSHGCRSGSGRSGTSRTSATTGASRSPRATSRFCSAAHDAIKRADPGAKVVLGALTNFAWQSIGQLYKVPGFRNCSTSSSVNGFTKKPADVILYLQLMRSALDRFRDGRSR